MLARLGRHYDQRVLEQFLYLPEVTRDHRVDEAWMKDWSEQLEQALRAMVNGDGTQYSIDVRTDDDGPAALVITRGQHGGEIKTDLPIRFFGSPEYAELASMGERIVDMIGDGAYVQRGEARQEVDSFKEAMDWFMAAARRGLNIQRYKGLGEMNPDQLWDTTVNPETRRLMRVQIEDAVAADEVFTTLMGDQVEPRREFIERNALAAENIDI